MSCSCDDKNCSNESAKKESLFEKHKIRWIIVALLSIVPFEILSLLSIKMPLWLEAPLFVAMLVIFGREVFVSGIKSLLKLNFSNINLLMTIAIFGAIYLRQFEEAVVIVVLFALGEALEDYGVAKSKSALEGLIEKTPKSALAKGGTEKTPIENIAVGAIIIIKPGDQIPLDGKVTFGNSLVDEAVITGEPLPKSKYEGDMVYAGSSNGQGYLEVKVTKTSADTTLAKIVELTYQSAEKKSQSQKFIENFAKYYTPAVMALAALIVVVPVALLGKPFDPWFMQALTVLIISCPCALVISTPVSIFSAIGNATRRGALIKGGRYLEELGKVKVLAFDKTRTLTIGEPVVSDIFPFNGFSQDEVLACAAGLESFSEHPIAKSVIEQAQKEKLSAHKFNNFKAVAGKGVTGECLVCNDAFHCLGNLKFIQDNQKDKKVEQYIIDKVNELEAQGKTAIIISENKIIKGVIGVTDMIRSESQEVIRQITALGVMPVMLTGDNEKSARFVANQVGITEVKAGLLPEQKDAQIVELTKKHQYVAMIGDGVNDAPALARATVGIAIGAVGSDLAVENADIALMSDNLQLVPYLLSLGRKTVGKIRFNVFLAVAVKIAFLTLAMFGISNLTMAIFADVGITLIVVANGLSLYRFNDSL